MLNHNDLNSTEEMLVRELHGFINNGELNNGEEIDALKDIFECFESIYRLRAIVAKT